MHMKGMKGRRGASMRARDAASTSEETKNDDTGCENKMVLCSENDEFTLSQDLCAMCGSFGKGEEGRLIACSQCGQSYHPFCVNIKVSPVVLSKGWRCLECTVCEGCGKPHDEGQLLLCDECDISYHTYCLDPPLAQVPQGTWKCRWCVICVKCKSTSPGVNSLWQKNYTECGPCASQMTCPACGQDYDENELIIQCIHCNRWLHAKCDQISTEEDCELAADSGYKCLLCRSDDELPAHLPRKSSQFSRDSGSQPKKELHEALSRASNLGLSATGLLNDQRSDHLVKLENHKAGLKVSRQGSTSSTANSGDKLSNNLTTERKINSKYQAHIMMDGVLLSDVGVNQIKSLFPEQPKKQRAKRGSKQNQNSTSLDEIEETSNKDEESVDNMEDGFKGSEADQEKEKKLKKLKKLGIGGFNLKQRSRGSKKDEDLSLEIAESDSLVQSGESPVLSASFEKPKRRRKLKKKPSLQDTFPAYLQEAFFGKGILDTTPKQHAALDDIISDEDVATEKITEDKVINLTPSEMAAIKVAQQPLDQAQDSSSCIDDDDLEQNDALRDLLPLPEDLGQDEELMNMLMNDDDDLDKPEDSLDELPVDEKRDDPMDSFNLSPNFNLEHMVGENALPQMDSKDVEDLFKGVLSPSQSTSQDSDMIPTASHPQIPQATNQALPSLGIPSQGSGMHPGKPVSSMGGKPRPFRLPASSPNISPLVSVSSMLPHGGHPMPSMVSPKPNNQINGPFQMPMVQQQPHSHPPPSIQQQNSYPPVSPSGSSPMIYSPQISDPPPSPWPDVSESESIPASQKNLLKWESDEALGPLATISPVLYANCEFPNLKKDYPSWADRVKQISKLWRQLPSDRRQPYLQKARENRAQNRIQKTQQEQSKFMSKEPARIPGTPGTPGVVEGMEDQEVKWRQIQAARQQQHNEGVMQPSESEMMSQVPLTLDSHHPQTPHSHPSPAMSMNDDLMSPRAPQTPNQMQMSQQHQHPNAIRPPPSPASSINVLQVSRVHAPVDPMRMSGPPQQSQQGQQTHMVSKPSEMVHSPASAGIAPGPRFSQIRPSTPQRSPFSPASPVSFQAQGTQQPQTPSQQQGMQPSPTGVQGPGQMSQHPNTPSSSNENHFHTPPTTPRPQSVDSAQHPPPSPFLSHQQPRTPGSVATPFSPSHGSQGSEQYVSSPVPPRPHSGHMSPGHSALSNTPHPPSNDPYSSMPGTPRVPTSQGSDQFSSPSPHAEASRQRPMHLPQSPASQDPYARSPMTPRPRPSYEQQESYSQPNASRPTAHQDPYARPPSTPHPASQSDPYSYQPGTPAPFAPQVRQRPPMPPPPPLQDPYARPVGTPMPPSTQSMNQPNDPYDRPPRTPQVPNTMDSPAPPIVSEGEMEGQPLTRPQLRDLLQRQQERRQQVQQMRTEAPRIWNQGMGDPNQRMTNPNMPVMRAPVMRPPDGFRQPPPPPGATRPRMPGFEQQMFRHPISPDPRFNSPRMQDPRMRQMLIQQGQIRVAAPHGPGGPMSPQSQPQQWIRPGPHPGPYGQQGPMPFQMHPNSPQMQMGPRSSMPPNQMPQVMQISNQQNTHMGPRFNAGPNQYPPNQPHMQPHIPPNSQPMQMSQNVHAGMPQPHPMMQPGMRPSHPGMQTDQQGQQINVHPPIERPPVDPGKHPSTQELVQQVTATPADLLDDDAPAEDIDDDELLGLGNDFNILEYADPELDQTLSSAAGKNNIFDEHLDDLDPDKVKDDQKEDKKESHSSGTTRDIPHCEKRESPEARPPPPQLSTPQTPLQVQRPPILPGQQPPPPYPGQGPTSVAQSVPPPPPYPAGMRSPMLHRPPRPNMPYHPGQMMTAAQRHPMIRPPGTSEQPPLLLEDLVEQEKREQQQQQFNVNAPPMASSSSFQDPADAIAQADSLLSDVDFERLKADILSDDSLSGPMQSPTGQSFHQNMPVQAMPQSNTWAQEQDGQHPPPPQMDLRSIVMHNRPPQGMHPGQRFPMMMHQQPMPGPPNMPPQGPMGGPMMGPGGPAPNAPGIPFRLASIPKPPTPPAEITTQDDVQLKNQYEKWLLDQQQLLSTQQKQLENEVQKLRKTKKTINARGRQLKKTGGDLSIEDSNELQRVTQEQNTLQKNLEQVRKLSKQHTNTMQEYRLKQQKRVNPQSIGVASPGPMAPRGVHSPMISMGNSGPGTPHGMQMQAGPSTPQSPAHIMSPSPMGGVMSPMMHSNSPAAHQPIPSPVPSAGTPASPMMNANMQSPIPQVHMSGQQMSPMVPPPPPTSETGMQVRSMVPGPMDDNNPFSDSYKDNNMAMQQHHSPRGPHPQMGHTFPNQGPHGPMGPHGPPRGAFPGQDDPNRTQMQYHPQHQRPQFRYPMQQMPPNQRPYGEMVGQQYQSQMGPQGYPHPQGQHPNSQAGYGPPQSHPHPHQMPSQQGQMIRRPPPPPYPGPNPHQQAMPQMGGQSQQQQGMRMYGPGPQQMMQQQYPQHMQQQQQQQQQQQRPMPPHQYQQHGGQPQPQLSYYNTPNQAQSMHHHQQQQHQMQQQHQQQQMKSEQIPISSSSPMNSSTPPRSMSSSPAQSTPVSMPTSGSQSSLTNMSHGSADSGYTSQDPMVGEAKTTMDFTIHEHGSGHENEAGNDAILQRCSDGQHDQGEQSHQQRTQSEPQPSQSQQPPQEGSEAAQQPVSDPANPGETSCPPSDTIKLASEVKQEPVDVQEDHETLETNNDSQKEPTISTPAELPETSEVIVDSKIKEESLNDVKQAEVDEGGEIIKTQSSKGEEKGDAAAPEGLVMKQNVLLKQLLQNCPSDADEGDGSIKTSTSKTDEKSDTSEGSVMKQNVLLKQLLQNCPSADSKDKSATAPASGTPTPPKSLLDARKELKIDPSTANSGTIAAPSTTMASLTPTVVAEINLKNDRIETKSAQEQQVPAPPQSEESSSQDNQKIEPSVTEVKIENNEIIEADKSSNSMHDVVLKTEMEVDNEPVKDPHESQMAESKDKEGETIDEKPNTISQTQKPAMKRSASPAAGGERKLSYLDIRRQQLEREPTPPLEENKPKRRRILKKKEKEPKIKEEKEVKVTEGPPSASTSRSNTPPALSAQSPGSGGKKRSRKSSHKSEEDYERFMNNFLNNLRSLPPMLIKEPVLRDNMNVLVPPGTGDLNSNEPKLRGSFGNAIPVNGFDYYSTVPFGKLKPPPIINCPPPPGSGFISSNDSSSGNRGFYNQEFTRIPPPSMITFPSVDQEVDYYMRDTESPDSIIPPSPHSPDVFKLDSQNTDRYASLKHMNGDTPDANNNEKCMSPIIEFQMPMPSKPIPRRATDQRETDKENEINATNQGKANQTLHNGVSCGPLWEAGNVAVTLTLSAANEVRGVLDALAKVLGISSINDLEIIERSDSPQHDKLPPLIKEEPGSRDMKMDILENGIGENGGRTLEFCKFCEIIVCNAGIKKKASELPPAAQDELDGEEVTFCSTSCCMQYALSRRGSSSIDEKGAATLVSHSGNKSSHALDPDLNQTSDPPPPLIKPGFDRLLPPMSPMMEDDEVSLSGMMSPKTLTPPAERLPAEEILSDAFLDEEKMSMTMSGEESSSGTVPLVEKKWKGIRYKSFKKSEVIDPSNHSEDANESELIKTEDEIAQENEKWKDKLVIFKPDPMPPDMRTCLLCHGVGDGKTNGASRLLNYDVARWIHLNCALWSSEVYETLSGSLMNVDLAVKKALTITCVRCRRVGASLKCFKPRCSNIYHFPCAVKEQCMFYKDKTLLCPQHSRPIPEQELTSFVVYRKVYINKDEQKQVASMIHQAEQSLIRIGNLIFLSIGQLLPHQLQAFHTQNYIFPVGYTIARFYWSKRKLGHRCKYICSIDDVNDKPEFKIEIHEPGFETEIIRGSSPNEVWKQIIDPVVKMRQEAGKIKVFTEYISGEDLFGLTEPTITRILESLPGVDTLRDYNFRYGRSPLLELPLAINPTGCARTEPKLRTHFKRPHTMHTSNASRSSLSSFTATEITSPYVKQFVHTKSSQYRKMKTEWRNNVYLARSRIQGLGLYAARDIEKHTMVIEYIGLIIRNEIAERNEKMYEAHNRGIYMFRLDDDRVIDATLQGGLARYINHSCNPNCVAESVEIDRDRKILIIANRRISRGEELSYDYKFDVEDDQHKIPCLCGAPNCRKWMN